MKTIYHGSVKKKRNTGTRVLLVLVALVLLMNIFDVLWPQTALRAALAPLVAVRSFIATPFTALYALVADKQQLIAERDALQERVVQLELGALQVSTDRSTEQAVTRERTFLRDGVVVPVLVRPPYSLYDSLVIDTREHAVGVGDAVFTYGVRIGTITHVDTFSATVGLFTSPGTKTPVRLGSVDAEAVGQGGGRYQITIPKDVVLTDGSAVVHPASFGALLGVVSARETAGNDTFQTVHVALPVAFSMLDAVTVVPPPAVLE